MTNCLVLLDVFFENRVHRFSPDRADVCGKHRTGQPGKCDFSMKIEESGIQPGFFPAALGLGTVDEAVVQAIGAALPELKAGGDKAVAAPEVGSRDLLAFESFFDLRESAFEGVTVGQDFALFGGPGTELAVAGAGAEIGVGLGGAGALHRAGDADLALQDVIIVAR